MYVQQTTQSTYNPTHWRPQKFLGGPHEDRGPQFGHPCIRLYLMSCYYTLDQALGWADFFCSRGKLKSKVVLRATKNDWYFHQMYVQQIRQCIYNPTHWGPQKLFGGP